MRFPGIGTARRAAARLRRRFGRRALVLCYHRVADAVTDPFLLCVTPAHFEEHLDVLRARGRPLPLGGLVRALRAGQLPDGSIVVTFDDGYADNLYAAKPLLERADVPATVFVMSGQLGSDREFWWDDLDRVLLQPGDLPAELQLATNGTTHRWELGDAARYGEDAARRSQGWKAWGERDPTARHTTFRELHRQLAPLPDGERRALVAQLVAWAGLGAAGRPSHRALSPDELLRLVDGGLVEVGAHTVTHPVLAAQPPLAQREEIERSKVELEAILGRPVTGFAYPYGAPGHFTAETAQMVREAGLTSACTTVSEPVYNGSDPFELPRLVVRDWNGEEFARRVEECLGA